MKRQRGPYGLPACMQCQVREGRVKGLRWGQGQGRGTWRGRALVHWGMHAWEGGHPAAPGTLLCCEVDDNCVALALPESTLSTSEANTTERE